MIRGTTQKATSFASIVLRGVGQIMLQENQLTGFLFLAGIFYSSFLMGLAAVLATVCGTATAFVLNYDRSEIEKGLYGFSAALVGVAIMLFLKPVVFSWILLIIGSALATVIQHFFIKREIPVFTLPFVLVTWAIILLQHFNVTDVTPVQPAAAGAAALDFAFVFKGYGQVIFQNSVIAGVLFFIAVLVSSPISALYGLAGGILSAAVALLFPVQTSDISLGLFSYNAVLCAIVFAGPQLKDGLWVLFSVLLSFFIQFFMVKFQYVPLTFPFVLASCLTLFFVRTCSFIIKTQIKHR